jgi:thiol:disulfide interchange protein DsbD
LTVKRLLVICLSALLLAMGWGCCHAGDTEYLDVDQAFRGNASRLDDHTVLLRLDVAPAYHLYRERLSVTAEGTGPALGEVVMPHGKTQFDANFGKTVELLQGAVPVTVPLAGQQGALRLQVHYQGCADEGLCYPPQTATVAVDMAQGRVGRVVWLGDEGITTVQPDTGAANTSPAATAAPLTATDASSVAADNSAIGQALRSGRWPALIAAFWLAGLLLSFTPCVLPMVPILSSIIVGQGTAVSRSRGFALAAAYVLGMALVYTGLGMAAGLAGEGLAAALQNPWVLSGFALLLSLLSLSMFGVFELQMPGFIQSRLSESSSRLPGGRFLGVFTMGGLSALIVGPCVAAPLAGALVFISQTRDVVVGGVALFSLALGMGVPLLLVGLSAGALLPRTGAWMNGVKTLFGVLLLAVALWIVSPVLPGRVLMLLIGAGLLVGACYMGLLQGIGSKASAGQRLAQGGGLVLAVLGVTQLVGALSGGTDPLQPLGHLAQARRGTVQSAVAEAGLAYRRIRNSAELDQAVQVANRPVMLDFYADWCVACKEMEHLTLLHASISPRLAGATLLQVDVTANNADDRALMKRFGVFGPPGILFFPPGGPVQAKSRVIGYEPPERFATALARAGL